MLLNMKMKMKTNSNLNELQIEAIENWDGNKILSINPNGSTTHQGFAERQQESYDATEFWCAMQKLDDLNVPRIDESNGQTYSVVGRIMWLAKNTNL